MIEPGCSVGRESYVAYLSGCVQRWRDLGATDEADRVAAKAALVARGEDDVSRAQRP